MCLDCIKYFKECQQDTTWYWVDKGMYIEKEKCGYIQENYTYKKMYLYIEKIYIYEDKI